MLTDFTADFTSFLNFPKASILSILPQIRSILRGAVEWLDILIECNHLKKKKQLPKKLAESQIMKFSPNYNLTC